MGLTGELEELRTHMEAAERSRKAAESELHEASDRVAELTNANSSLSTQKRKLENDIQAMHVRAYQGCSGAGTRGTASPRPAFFDRRDASPTPPHFFGLKFVQKVVHCCNWLLTETQCKIISVQQN